MSTGEQRLFLVRHGDTAWSESGQYTGRTDLPLNKRGEEHAARLAGILGRFHFSRVFTSPLQRASMTCELAGFGKGVAVDGDLFEWDYGRFEGKLTSHILEERPGWKLFRDGCPDGEMPHDVAARADRFIRHVRSIEGDILAFSSGHMIRMLGVRWIRLPIAAGQRFTCRPTSVSILAFKHNNREEPSVALWNYMGPQPEEDAAGLHPRKLFP